jgi:hypothetical protein
MQINEKPCLTYAEAGEVDRVYPRPNSPRIVTTSIFDYIERLRNNLPRTRSGQKQETYKWPQSTKGPIAHTGGATTSSQQVKQLGDLLAARKKAAYERKPN